MAKYIYMEDSILEGLEKLPKLASTREMQQRLLDATKKFNKFSYEFQEQWNNEFWAIYEAARNPKKTQTDFQQSKSHQQISKKLQDLQEMAITLTRLSRGNNNEYSSPMNKEPFAMVDEEALKYKEPTIKEQTKMRECGRCFIF